MIEDQLNHDFARGAHAERLLSDELLNEMFDTMEREYIAHWKTWPAHDAIGRERIWQAVNILGLVKSHLQRVSDGGKIARAEIEQLTRLREKAYGGPVV